MNNLQSTICLRERPVRQLYSLFITFIRSIIFLNFLLEVRIQKEISCPAFKPFSLTLVLTKVKPEDAASLREESVKNLHCFPSLLCKQSVAGTRRLLICIVCTCRGADKSESNQQRSLESLMLQINSGNILDRQEKIITCTLNSTKTVESIRSKLKLVSGDRKSDFHFRC